MNLLPESEKNKVIKALRTRFFIVGMFIIGTALLINTVLLVPPYLLANTKLLENKVRAETTSLKNDKSYLSTLLVPKELNIKTGSIRTLTPTKTKVEILSDIFSSKPSTIKVDSIMYSRPKEDEGEKIVISGVSMDRKSLIDYSQLLKTNPAFVSVDVPVSSLTKGRNLPFTLSITIKE